MGTRAQVSAAGQAEGRAGQAPTQSQQLSAGPVWFEPASSAAVTTSAGNTKLTPCREQLAAEEAAFISIQAFPALLDLPQELEVSAVSCGSRHTAAVTRECPVGQGQHL